MKALRHLLTPLLPLLVCGCSVARTEYSLDHASATVANVRITGVTVTRDETRVAFVYEAPPGQTRRIGIHPPGHTGAFIIQSADRTQTYGLVGADGISILPERTTVPGGERLEFALTFDPIPKGLRTIHVGEGEYTPETGESSWHFLDLALK
ncbi:MAG: hypothetical protein ACE5JG_06725 [Planctomycetota bacterium]